MNFTVPDEKSLNRKQKEIPSQIWCGIIEEAFKLLDPLKEYVISIDGKKITSGLGKNDTGHINLWGYEMPPLKERKEKQLKNLQKVEKIEINIDSSMDNPELNELSKLLSLMLTYIVEICKTEMGHHNLFTEIDKAGIKQSWTAKVDTTLGWNQ